MRAMVTSGALTALAMMVATAATAQDVGKPGAGPMGDGLAATGPSMTGAAAAGQATTGQATATPGMTAAVARCRSLSPEAMTRNRRCAAIAKMHPEMMTGGSAPVRK